MTTADKSRTVASVDEAILIGLRQARRAADDVDLVGASECVAAIDELIREREQGMEMLRLAAPALPAPSPPTERP